MKKYILILLIPFLAFTFTGNSPGWYQQTLPVNDFVNDIFFIDTLNGWAVTDGSATNNDTSYILHTSNGGDNWTIQNTKVEQLNVIQFLDKNTGYAAGGRNGTVYLSFYKTTNEGNDWTPITIFEGIAIEDMQFINVSTGWICDDNTLNGGLFKTTNEGINWVQQLSPSFASNKIFFINSDTGWMGSNEANGKLYRTTNGGNNWQLQNTFSLAVRDIFFINSQKGWLASGSNYYTTNSGVNWNESNESSTEIHMVTDKIGWGGTTIVSKVMKTTDGGLTWGYQNAAVFVNSNIFATDTLHAWAGSGGGFIGKTTDGGGPITTILQISNEIPENFVLYQNYPNPFNPETTIEFGIKKTSDISIQIYDLSGRITGGIGYSNKSPGRYSYTFDGNGLTSGIYFYSLFVNGIRIDTKKMMLVK